MAHPLLDFLVAHAAPADLIIETAQLIAAANITEHNRSSARERMRAVRERARTVQNSSEHNGVSYLSFLEDRKKEKKETAIFKNEFDEVFWPLYPNKVGKPIALRSWLKVRRVTALEPIMDGLRRYVNKSDDRAWCNPSTWLNQDRWNDRPAQAKPKLTELQRALGQHE